MRGYRLNRRFRRGVLIFFLDFFPALKFPELFKLGQQFIIYSLRLLFEDFDTSFCNLKMSTARRFK